MIKNFLGGTLLSSLLLLGSCSSDKDVLNTPAQETPSKTVSFNMSMQLADVPEGVSNSSKMGYDMDANNGHITVNLQHLLDQGRTTVPVHLIFKNTVEAQTRYYKVYMKIKNSRNLVLGVKDQEYDIPITTANEGHWYVKAVIGGYAENQGWRAQEWYPHGHSKHNESITNTRQLRILCDALWDLGSADNTSYVTDDSGDVGSSIADYRPLPIPMVSDWVKAEFLKKANGTQREDKLPQTSFVLKPFGFLLRFNITNATPQNFTGHVLSFANEGTGRTEQNRLALVNHLLLVPDKSNPLTMQGGAVNQSSGFSLQDQLDGAVHYHMSKNSSSTAPRSYTIKAGEMHRFAIWLIQRQSGGPSKNTTIIALHHRPGHHPGYGIMRGHPYVRWDTRQIDKNHFENGKQYPINLRIKAIKQG